MIRKVEHISNEELKRIKEIVGEAFVTNELFYNWGTIEERREDVIKYMELYVDFVYEAGELYANDEFTGFIGLEDSDNANKLPQIKMLIKMMFKIRYSKLKSLVSFAKQISKSNEKYAKTRHIDALMVCVDKKHQGKGIASELINFAKDMSDEHSIPLLFDTDMKEYADMYQHFGCKLYNTVKADNGVTRYSLCYIKGED
jgi:GNAT superfamily N-acetyltransferase